MTTTQSESVTITVPVERISDFLDAFKSGGELEQVHNEKVEILEEQVEDLLNALQSASVDFDELESNLRDTERDLGEIEFAYADAQKTIEAQNREIARLQNSDVNGNLQVKIAALQGQVAKLIQREEQVIEVQNLVTGYNMETAPPKGTLSSFLHEGYGEAVAHLEEILA